MDLQTAARRSGRGALEAIRLLERKVTSPLHILCYHRVVEPFCDPWDLSVSPRSFDQQLATLRDISAAVRLHDVLPHHKRRAVETLGRPRTRRPRVAVTFDDGYVDNLQNALPLLERHDVPATVFVPTAFVGMTAFWWDRLALLALGTRIAPDCLADAFAAVGVAPSDPPPDGWSAAVLHRALSEELTLYGPHEIDGLIDRVCDGLGVTLEPSGRPMSTDELTELAAHPLITIGAHSQHHRMLTRLPQDHVHRELTEGTACLDDLFGPAPRVLAYPHGDADRLTAATARGAGFAHALTTSDRPVSVLDGPLLLPRRHPKDVDGEEFAKWLVSG